MKKTSAKVSKTVEKDAADVARAAHDATTYKKLFTWNKWLATAHAVQAIIILVISAAKTFPVTSSYLSINSLVSETADSPVLATAVRHVFDLNLGLLVALFFCMSAIAHAVAATVYCRRYEADLHTGINRLRWIEYGFSASTMLVAIAVLSGVTELSLLIAIFAFSFIMNMMGLAMEIQNKGCTSHDISWFPYIIGCVAGAIPWVIIGLYLVGASLWGEGTIPAFVYWIYGTMFLAFNCFAVTMYLQYKKHGKWADYLHGERIYMILSLVAKTVLAWQVFAGALRP